VNGFPEAGEKNVPRHRRALPRTSPRLAGGCDAGQRLAAALRRARAAQSALRTPWSTPDPPASGAEHPPWPRCTRRRYNQVVCTGAPIRRARLKPAIATREVQEARTWPPRDTASATETMPAEITLRNLELERVVLDAGFATELLAIAEHSPGPHPEEHAGGRDVEPWRNPCDPQPGRRRPDLWRFGRGSAAPSSTGHRWDQGPSRTGRRSLRFTLTSTRW